VDHRATENAPDGGTVTRTYKLDRTFSGSAKLDLRNEGSVIAQTQQAMMDPDKMKNMTQAEMMKYSQDMLATLQYTANWMAGAPELGDGDDAMLNHMKGQAVPVTFNGEDTKLGVNVSNEMGDKYDYLTTRTGTGSGAIYLGDQCKFEVNTQSKTYWLLLPYTGQSLDTTRPFRWETVEKTRPAGATAWKEDARRTDDAPSDWMPAITLESSPGWGGPLIEGTYTAPDRITGEKTLNGSYNDGPHSVPVMVTYRYTVSSTPIPARAAEKK
jgi:hypothetical protein